MQFRTAVKSQAVSGFTLIELSIVLVIIGLIIGGVLVGRDLISAAGVRAQISQIEKYQTAVNTFRGKYGYLPGDIPEPYATQYGFVSRPGNYQGEGDANEVIEGVDASQNPTGLSEGAGETLMFWMDLSQAGLIEGRFTSGSPSVLINPPTATPAQINNYLPVARIGQGNSIYVWSGGYCPSPACSEFSCSDGKNYFGLANVIQLLTSWTVPTSSALTVAQAYNIDTKIDDGLPQSGRVTTQHLRGIPAWATGGFFWNEVNGPPFTTAVAPQSTNCFDNGGVVGIQHYSMGQNNGAGMNCALSFQFQ